MKKHLMGMAVAVALMAKADPRKGAAGGGSKSSGGSAVKRRDDDENQTQTDGGALVLVQDHMPDHIRTDQQRGSEQVKADDLVIPRLEVIQAISPQVTEGAAEFIAHAKAGDLMNSVTNQIYGREVFVVPVHYTKQWLVWRDRKKGGGFLGSFADPDSAERKAEDEGGKEGGIEAVDTPTHLCLLIDTKSGKVDEIILSMPRTKAKISRQWNSVIRMAGGDRFSRVYRITTAMEENAKGKFFNYVVAQCGFPNKIVYQMAEKLYGQIAEGQRKVVMDTNGFEGEGGDEGGGRNDM